MRNIGRNPESTVIRDRLPYGEAIFLVKRAIHKPCVAMIELNQNNHTVRVHRVDSGDALISACEEFLYGDEARNNSILAVAPLTVPDSNIFTPPYWYAYAETNDQVVGCALYADPDGLVLTDMPVEAAMEIASAFMDSGIEPKRIAGPDSTARAVANAIANKSGQAFHAKTFWNSYVLTESVKPPQMAPGSLRHARPEESDVVAEFGERYGNEKPALVDVSSYLLRKLDDELLWAWDHDGIRTLIGMAGRTRNVIRVAAVYTPDEHRRKGYASAAVWEVTEHYLNNGCRATTLMVDKRDPQVGRIYEKLGYRIMDDRIELVPVDDA